MSSRPSAWSIAGVTLLTAAVAYAVYFDYKRRNDVEFRKRLRKEKKRVNKSVASSRQQSEASIGVSGLSANDLKAALDKVKTEDVPTGVEDKEKYFMSQVGMGEQLCTQGPAFHVPAALCFYRALRVYPSPVELIVIYEKTVPEPVFKIVMELTNMDVKNRVEGYYDSFPAKSMNVTVKNVDDPAKGTHLKALVLAKDVKAGEIIYKEQPVVTALDADLQPLGTHCTHCLRAISPGLAIPAPPTSDRLSSTYCSKDCQLKSTSQAFSLLFSSEPLLPASLATEMSEEDNKVRERAQAKYAEHLKSAGTKWRGVTLMVGKFVARQVSAETGKMMPVQNKAVVADMPVLNEKHHEYSLFDHLERLRFIDVGSEGEVEREAKLLREVLQAALPGVEQFVTDERHATMMGKMAYNAYGVCYKGGRDDKPVSTARPEDQERTRTPYGTQRQVGSGFYAVSAYIRHSCQPNCRPSFASGTAELHLIASQDLKAGDEITVAYVDVTQRPIETPVESRRRRRIELARGWRFACSCEKCESDGPKTDEEEKEMPKVDGSKVEDTVTRVEGMQGTLDADP